jgi:membrane-bound metal-dependent hydrolase YbcI (DUF457 family)
MILNSHFAYPVLLFVLIAKLFGITYSAYHLVIVILFALLPDIDFFYHGLVKKGKYDDTFKHHEWFTHWPVFYAPLLILLILFPSFNLLLICGAIYSHLILDSFFVNGIMWLHPFSKRKFAFFKIDHCHGWEWYKFYKTKPIYKIDMIATIIALVFLFSKFF